MNAFAFFPFSIVFLSHLLVIPQPSLIIEKVSEHLYILQQAQAQE